MKVVSAHQRVISLHGGKRNRFGRTPQTKRAIQPSEDISELTKAIELGDSAISIAAEVSLWATTSDRMPNRNKTERCEGYCAR